MIAILQTVQADSGLALAVIDRHDVGETGRPRVSLQMSSGVRISVGFEAGPATAL
jgi:hypothetical protein